MSSVTKERSSTSTLNSVTHFNIRVIRATYSMGGNFLLGIAHTAVCEKLKIEIRSGILRVPYFEDLPNFQAGQHEYEMGDT